ncbi:MAG: acyl-CoA synthetase, partial [Flammeovirgaceae bacterium]|nr:acyl-CoA synthetase [Flammeovirgaceae bacterium]MDW8287421.1 acyl-CoA synthetase [Flammeovirgaceae bacterium]
MNSYIYHSFAKHLRNIVLEDNLGKYSGETLAFRSYDIAISLLTSLEIKDLEEEPILMLLDNNFWHPVVFFGIWRAGGTAVPLNPAYTQTEIAHIAQDTGARCIVVSQSLEKKLEGLPIQLKKIHVENVPKSTSLHLPLPKFSVRRKALMIYTSGTTSKPKGVVHTHKSLGHQVRMLQKAWHWTANDRILNVLPLNHVHGIVNVLFCSLASGAYTYMLPKFDAPKVWELFIERNFTLFMAVPTIYYKLIEEYEKADKMTQQKMTEACQKMRLMVSGSAALPLTVLERWKEISGHVLLERYGMSETGMLLSNPYEGERKAGTVGLPLPNVKVKVVDEQGKKVKKGESGELWVKTKGVFAEYWRNEEATKNTFIRNWFKTGDFAVEDNDGYFKILGRISTDILKVGGYKVSALEIEEAIRTHSSVIDCAVVGLDDEKWGEKVAAAIVSSREITQEELQEWLKDKLAKYKIPATVRFVKELPKNAL